MRIYDRGDVQYVTRSQYGGGTEMTAGLAGDPSQGSAIRIFFLQNVRLWLTVLLAAVGWQGAGR